MKKSKNTKRVIFVFLALLVCLQPLCAFAESEGEEDAGLLTECVEEEIPETEEILAEEEQSAILSEDSEAGTDTVVEEDASTFSGESDGFPEDVTSAETKSEEGEDKVVEEAVEAEPVFFCEEESGPDNDTLFRAYFEDLLMPKPKLRRPIGASNLVGVDLAVYSFLAEQTNAVADRGGSTVFQIQLSKLGTQLSWTQEELGGITIISDGEITPEAKAAVSERLNTGNLRLILSALQQDYPFGMYWYDKTKGAGTKLDVSYKLSALSTSIWIKSGTATYSLSVAYGYGSGYVVDSAEVNRAQTAAGNARAIVSDYSSYSDYEKLRAYKDTICTLTSYNNEAASGGVPYGDPWQPIYVFDGDPETRVVCEGYSKAFEYLCDMSEFASPAVSCISVYGLMETKDHMWNVVTLANGKNVLADVTNSDEGTSGADGRRFLVGYTAGSVSEGYGIADGSYTVWYVYDDNVKTLMTEEELTLTQATCTVTFVNERGPEPEPQNVPLWSKALRPEDPVCDGWAFRGWYDGEKLYDFDSPVISNVTLTAKWEELTITAAGSNLSVLGKIGLNFFTTIPEGLMDGIYAEMYLGNTVHRIDGADFEPNGQYYVFRSSLPAAEDRTAIGLKFFHADGSVIPMVGNRVEENRYVDSIYAYLKRQEAGTNAKLKPFARAMRNYCEYARQNFGVDAGIPFDLDPIVLDQSKLARFAVNAPQMPAGITYTGLSLVLESDTSLKVYFTVGSGAKISDYTFTIDGNPAEPELHSGNIWYVTVPNIPAAELDEAHNVTVNGVTITNVSALSYANNVLLNSRFTQNLKQTVMALYYYNEAANQYFG